MILFDRVRLSGRLFRLPPHWSSPVPNSDIIHRTWRAAFELKAVAATTELSQKLDTWGREVTGSNNVRPALPARR